MNTSRLALLALALLAAVHPGTAAARARRGEAPKPQSARISNAVGIYVTPRGQSYFWDNLQELIFRQGFDLHEGGFGPFSYEASEPIDLDHVPLRYEGYAGTLGAVRDILGKWLRGFRFEDPKLAADVDYLYYSAEFRRFGLRVDHAATSRLLKNRGIVVVFEAEIPELWVDAEGIKGRDLNNPFVGEFGSDRVHAELKGKPLKITVPMSLEIGKDRKVGFRMLDFAANVNEVRFSLDPAQGAAPMRLKLPAVRMRINGKSVELDPGRVEQELLAQKDRLLGLLQEYAAAYANERIPGIINKLVADNYPELLSEINEMDPPGGPARKPQAKYRFGLSPDGVALRSSLLAVSLSAFVEDPVARDPDGSVSHHHTRYAPALRADPARYDAALTINQDLLNRFIGLNYRRGYHSEIAVDGGSPLRILEAPEFSFGDTTRSDQVRLHVKLQHRAEGLEKLAVRQKVAFEVDVIVKLVKSADGRKVQGMMQEIDLSSLKVEEKDLRFLIGRKVRPSLENKLRAQNAQLAKAQKPLGDPIDIPAQIGGIPIQLKALSTDPNGYVVFYFEYERKKTP